MRYGVASSIHCSFTINFLCWESCDILRSRIPLHYERLVSSNLGTYYLTFQDLKAITPVYRMCLELSHEPEVSHTKSTLLIPGATMRHIMPQ